MGGHMINWEDEMNNNFYEIPGDWYSEFNNNFMNSVNMPNMNNNNLADPKVALERGNLFSNLYEPYNGYSYGKIKASSMKEEMLYSILNLFLSEKDNYHSH